MMVLKKKEIVAAALVVLIGVAGYMNWSYQDTIRVTDGEIYEETGKRLGEAQYVNTTKKDVEKDTENKVPQDQLAAAKLEKENARSKSMEILKETAENESFDEATRKDAQNRILKMAENVEKEATIESIAAAKGYSGVFVYIDSDMVDILVKKDGMSEKDVIILKDIAMEQLKIGAENIKIVQVQ